MPSLFVKNRWLIAGVLLVVLAVLWRCYVARWLVLPLDKEDLSFEVSLFSTDNFYDAEAEEYMGEERTVSSMKFVLDELEDGVGLVKNVFRVETQDGDLIVNLERDYGVNLWSGEHLSGFGDADREGYLFAPRMKGIFAEYEDKADYLYWHINYDASAKMRFVSEDKINGLLVYHYRSSYEGERIDQTEFLTHLPGVPDERGVVLEPVLDLWIEPYTGLLVKYQDQTVAYYYEQESGEKLEPWNFFRNSLSLEGVALLTSSVKEQKSFYFVQTAIFPVLFVILASIFVFVNFKDRL